MNAARARWSAQSVVVLRAAVDVVEGTVFIHGDVVELRNRQVGQEGPVLAAVEALVDAAVATHAIVAWAPRIDPDHVIVHMSPFLSQASQRFAAIVAHL